MNTFLRDSYNVFIHMLILGGPYGAVGVDLAFEAMLCKIFGEDFIESFKVIARA